MDAVAAARADAPGGAPLPTLDEIRAARERIAHAVVRTPLVRLGTLGGSPGIYLKLENLQPIGSFKIRGATNAIARLPAARLALGVVTASAGNMAQGVAWCARELRVPCTVIAPDGAPDTKIKAIERLGGRVIKVPFAGVVAKRWSGARIRASMRRSSMPSTTSTSMAGNGNTLALEILEDLPDVGAVVIPWGGGGLACGIAAGIKQLKPDCRAYSAEVAQSAPFAAALAAGSPQRIKHVPSWVDGIGSETVFPRMFEHARALLDGTLVAPIEAIAAALRLMAERNRIIAEGAGACPVACALAGGTGAGPIVCIVSGGNIDASKLCMVLSDRRLSERSE